MHDKAFEIGLFTLNEKFEIVFGSPGSVDRSSFVDEIEAAEGKKIRLTDVLPLPEALAEHRQRVRAVSL
jgi:hypothetical protein